MAKVKITVCDLCGEPCAPDGEHSQMTLQANVSATGTKKTYDLCDAHYNKIVAEYIYEDDALTA